jgi:hypothetical protein
MGGLWAYVWASSEAEITNRLNVELVSALPEWLTTEVPTTDRKPRLETVDIDGAMPDWMKR